MYSLEKISPSLASTEMRTVFAQVRQIVAVLHHLLDEQMYLSRIISRNWSTADQRGLPEQEILTTRQIRITAGRL